MTTALFWVFRFNDNGTERTFAAPSRRLPELHYPPNSNLLYGEIPAGKGVVLAAGFFQSGEAALRAFENHAIGLCPIERKNGVWELVSPGKEAIE